MGREIRAWAVLPKNWSSKYWSADVDLADTITREGLCETRRRARMFRVDDEAVVKVTIYFERDGGY